MLTILLGNGFNIELGGQDYLNKSIIKRLINNIKTKDYSAILFNDQGINNDELEIIIPGLYDEFKKIKKGLYDKYCSTSEDISLLSMLKTRYGLSTNITDIGMEDFFVILRLFHIKYNDPADLIKSTHEGLCYMLLDAIFNEGRIQKIASKILPRNKDYLADTLTSYDDIYTVNYDSTAEIIAGKKVFYLHGDFETLHDQYNPNTLIGHYFLEKGATNPITPTTRHFYCNGLMGFSGTYKEHIMQIFENGQFGAETILNRYNTGMNAQDHKKLESLKDSENEGEQLAYGIISAKINHPWLGMHQYPMKKFKVISGDLHILGISPYNDEHIWNAIVRNPQLNKIIYYYHEKESMQLIESNYSDKRFEFVPDSAFWSS